MTLRIHMSIHNDDLHKTTAKRNVNGGVVGIDNYLMNINYLPIIFDKLTVAFFQINPGTGTANYPQYLNDGKPPNTPGTLCWMNILNQYVEVIFTQQYEIKKYRFYGGGDNADGFFKIQYYTKYGWLDNTINIPTKSSYGWTAWTNLTSNILTNKIRIIATKIDSCGINSIYELEMKG